jgi:heat shock protein HslJ
MPARLHRLALLALAAVALATLAACGSDHGTTSTTTTEVSAASSGDLSGSWALESYSSGGAEVTAPAPVATITFASDGTFQGKACNSFSGTWTEDSGTVALTLGPMTQMACVDAGVQAQETAITTGFPKVDAATVSGDSLELTGNGISFTFTRRP